MSLRLFADQCVPAEIADILKGEGFEVILLRNVLSPRSPDTAVIAQAQQLGAVLLSLNGDFADIVTYPPPQYAGIIAIQLHNHPEIIPKLMAKLVDFLRKYSDQEYFRGKLLVVEVHRIRIRNG
jgi:predicted nuclease of predicted toxin-antitoxin system